MNDERKATIEVDMTDDEWIELLCLCEEINLTPGDLAVAFCQEVIRQQALLRSPAAWSFASTDVLLSTECLIASGARPSIPARTAFWCRWT